MYRLSLTNPEKTLIFLLYHSFKGQLPAWEVFLENYSSLSDPRQIPPEQAAFLAGYLCHLQADWLWVKDIFDPIFGPSSTLEHLLAPSLCA